MAKIVPQKVSSKTLIKIKDTCISRNIGAVFLNLLSQFNIQDAE